MPELALIPLEGLVCRGRQIDLAWPRPEDYDRITALRNQASVRRWFTDDSPLDPQRNRQWLATGMRRPQEALFSLRWRTSDLWLGTLGWTDWNPAQGTALFGRVMLDAEALRAVPRQQAAGVALDAALGLRDFAFEHMALHQARTYCLAENILALRLNRRIGMQDERPGRRQRPDGSWVDTVEMRLNRETWLQLRHGHE